MAGLILMTFFVYDVIGPLNGLASQLDQVGGAAIGKFL